MTDAVLRGSLIFHILSRLGRAFTRAVRGSFTLRLLSDSAIISFLCGRLPVVIGVGAGLLFVIPHDYFNNMYSVLMMLALTVLVFVAVLTGRCEGPSMRGLSGYALVFALMVVVSAVFSSSFSTSLKYVLFYMAAFMGFMLTRTALHSRKDVLVFTVILLLAVTVSGLYGCYQSIVGVPINYSQVDLTTNANLPGRVYSFFENANNFAEILILTLPFFMALFFLAPNRYVKLAVLVCAVPPALSLLFTYSRGGWVAFAAGVLVFFFFTYRWVVPALCVAAVAMMPALPSTIRQRIISAFTGEDASIAYRGSIRETMLPVLALYWPFGSGLGSETVRSVITKYYDTHTEVQMMTKAVAPHAHNIFLQLWGEMGALGVTSFCGTMIAFFRRCLRNVFDKPREVKFMAAAGFAAIAGSLVIGLVEYIWFYPRVFLLFWLVVGITLQATENNKTRE